MKKDNAAKMRSRSSQSAFSSAVIRCFEVPIKFVRVSCVVDVVRKEAVDVSTGT